MNIKSIEEAVRTCPFNRYSKFRDALLVVVDPGCYGHTVDDRGNCYEHSHHTDDDLIQKINDTKNTAASLQALYDSLNAPIKQVSFVSPPSIQPVYREFKFETPNVQAIEDLKELVEPFRLHKGTLIEPIKFQGKTPIVFRVVAYDDLITILGSSTLTQVL